MIGTMSKLSVRISRKNSDKEYGSFGVEAEAEVSLPADADFTEAFDALDSLLTAAVGMSMKEKRETIEKQQASVAQTVQQPPVVQQVQPAPVQETRVPVDGEHEYRIIDVDHFEIVVGADNIRACKVMGGPFRKFGVRCWPEPLEAVGIQLETLEAGKFSLPDGYKKAKVLMDGDKPKKIWAFLKG